MPFQSSWIGYGAKHGGINRRRLCPGHSKWANIKHKKVKTDALKAKLATKIGREITVAARMGGADPTGNMRLKLAFAKARENNIP